MSRMSSFFLGALLVVCLGSASASAIEGVKKDDKGIDYIMTEQGEKWAVLGEDSGKTFFVNEATKAISWEDPRIEPSESNVHGVKKDGQGRFFVETDAGESFYVYKDPSSKKLFFHNPQTQTTTWDDPRTVVGEGDGLPAPVPKLPAPATSEKLRLLVVAVLPVMLFVLGVAARIYYLHTHYPELLFPTKERRDRRRASGGKFKAQKARGKMSQDGKGGRSANS